MHFDVENICAQDLVLPKRILKEHPESQINQIIRSIEQFGFNDPIAIDMNNEIIEGIGRVLAARKLNLETIPAIRLTHLTEAQKSAYRIAHNKICLNSVFNLEALRLEFEALCNLDDSLISFTGFESAELDDLLKQPDLPDLGPELTESLNLGKSVTCPHCGKEFHA